MTHTRWLRPASLLGWMFVFAGLVAPARPAQAHGAPHVARFVALTGVNQGRCDDARRPCRTIQYAVRNVAGKGDEIRVAAGEYAVASDETHILLSNLIVVRGGFSTGDLFATQDPARHLTVIAGMPSQHREQLRTRGFALAQDRNGGAEPAAQPPQAPTARINCVGGKAGPHDCVGIDLLAHVPLLAMSSAPIAASNIWGFMDLNTRREYALIGIANGTAVFDVTNPASPREIGTVRSTNVSSWRELRVYQFFNQQQNRWNAYAYVSSDVVGTPGLQIIDLNQLSAPTPSVALAATYTAFSRSHTVYLSGADLSTGATLPGQTPHLFVNGANTSRGAFRMLSLANPLAPTLTVAPSLIADYTHDGTTLTITDARTADCAQGHNPCEIYIDYNENTVDLWDVTVKTAPALLSTTPYVGSAYTHSGWYTDDKRYVFIQDEIDEQQFGHNSRVRTMDIFNLRLPTITTSWTGPTPAIDHNGYTIGNSYYMSNYQRGLTILDITNPLALQDVAFFDTFPASNDAEFNGAWGVYPYFPSGTIIVSDIEGGLFVLRESPFELAASSTSPQPAGATVAFSTTVATSAPLNYTWSFGDGSGGQGAAPTHSYATAGTYTVTVTATNGLRSDVDQLRVTITAASGATNQLYLPFVVGAAASPPGTAGAVALMTMVVGVLTTTISRRRRARRE